jgi:hypothetical protein
VILRLALPLLLLFAVAACGGDDDEAAPATAAATTEAASAHCIPVGSDFMTPLGNATRDDAHRLRNGQAVESEDHDDVHFVSAEVYGPGVAAGTVGTWATTSLGGAEAIWTVDDVSREYSDLRDGTQVAGVSMEDDGAQESRDCAAANG